MNNLHLYKALEIAHKRRSKSIDEDWDLDECSKICDRIERLEAKIEARQAGIYNYEELKAVDALIDSGFSEIDVYIKAMEYSEELTASDAESYIQIDGLFGLLTPDEILSTIQILKSESNE